MTVDQPSSENPPSALVPSAREFQAALFNALRLWADSVTALSTERREEGLSYKQKVVASFFSGISKVGDEICPLDVEGWRKGLEAAGLKPRTVYARVCFLSSFFEWAMRDPLLRERIKSNPARLALPKAPKAYQTERVQAWTDEEMQAIVDVVGRKAALGDVVGKRDYAILLFYLMTGMRRQEVISLRGGNVKLNDESITLTGKVKGGDYVGREVLGPVLKEALLDYLSTSGRLGALDVDSPLWTRHDRAGRPGAPLSSHSFSKNLKGYARSAGIEKIHIHQTRHTFARIISEETGSIVETQDALGHKNLATTRVYVGRIAVKRDKHSRQVTARLNIK